MIFFLIDPQHAGRTALHPSSVSSTLHISKATCRTGRVKTLKYPWCAAWSKNRACSTKGLKLYRGEAGSKPLRRFQCLLPVCPQVVNGGTHKLNSPTRKVGIFSFLLSVQLSTYQFSVSLLHSPLTRPSATAAVTLGSHQSLSHRLCLIAPYLP